MSQTPDSFINSWGDFLATPPNMCGTPPNDLLINIPPSFSPMVPETPIQPLFVPTPITVPAQQPPPVVQKPSFPTSASQTFAEYGEVENRCLCVNNANPTTTKNEILDIFGHHGVINKIDMNKINEGLFTVDYFDIRHANSAKMLLNGSKLKGYKLSISFAPLPIIVDPKKPPNNGTIVIFHLPQGITDDQIMTIFSQFGEIRQIRGTPTKSQQKFVEYWDTRSAESALMSMSGQYVMGNRVSIEFSLPGGFRRGMQKVETPHSKKLNM